MDLQHVRMTIHGAPICSHFLSLNLSTLFLENEPITPPQHTHTFQHTKEDGLVHRQESSHVCCPFFHPVIPVAQMFSQPSTSLPVFCSLCLFRLTKTWFIQRLQLPTGREQWREVQKAPWPSLPHLPSFPRDFPHPSTDLRFVLTCFEITQVDRR